MMSASARSLSARSSRPTLVVGLDGLPAALGFLGEHADRARRPSGDDEPRPRRCGQTTTPCGGCRASARHPVAWRSSGLPGVDLRGSPVAPGRSARETRRWGSGPTDVGRPSSLRCLVLAGGLLALRFLALALHARLLVVLASSSLREDAALLDLLVEASEGALEGLVLTDTDLCQPRITSRPA